MPFGVNRLLAGTNDFRVGRIDFLVLSTYICHNVSLGNELIQMQIIKFRNCFYLLLIIFQTLYNICILEEKAYLIFL